jgi:AcrR family transcriptional regulator
MTAEIKQKEERTSKIRDMKSDLILDAALKVFSQKGVYETRLEDIAAEAGFSKASLYNYYPNKETIILNLATREYESFIEVLNNSPEYQISQEQAFEKNLHRYLLLSLKTFERHFNFIVGMNIFEFVHVKSSVVDENIQQRFLCLRELRDENGILRILYWARKNGELDTEFSDISLCRFVEAAHFGTIHDWICDKKVGDIEKTVNDLCKLLINGMKK